MITQKRIKKLLLATVVLFFTVMGASSTSAAPNVPGGTVYGRVFRDWNGDGKVSTYDRGITEYGVSNVLIEFYDASNAVVASTTSSGSGAYSVVLSGIADGTPLRMEIRIPDSLDPGATVNRDDYVSFLITPSTSLQMNIALADPGDYTLTNAVPLVTAVHIPGDPLAGGTAGTGVALVTVPNVPDTSQGAGTTVTTASEIGAVYGLGVNPGENIVYAAAVLRRHAGFGPEGTGGIYRIDLATNNVTPLVNFDTDLGIDTGVVGYTNGDPHSLTGDRYAPQQDANTFAHVGKASFGDLDVAEDGNSLYVVSLGNQTLYQIAISDGTVINSVNLVTAFNTVYGSCSNGQLRPWGLGVDRGKVFAGAVCDASSGSAANLRARVISVDAATLGSPSPVLDFALNFTRGDIWTSFPGTGNWNPWTDTMPAPVYSSGFVHPQPILSNIEFRNDGRVVLGFADRFGLQTGQGQYRPDVPPASNSYEFSTAGGDLLLSCYDINSGTYILEGSAGCTRPGVSPLDNNNNQGPNGGEWYFEDNGLTSNEILWGGVAVVPGESRVSSTSLPASAILSSSNGLNAILLGSISWLEHNGMDSFHFGMYLNHTVALPPQIGKAAGLGDLEPVLPAWPMKIGNRVWYDKDGNGIQDADEPGVPVVPVHLYEGTTLVASTQTDATGHYSFLAQRNTSYTVAVEPPGGLTLANANPGIPNTAYNDHRDSDGSIGNGAFSGLFVASVTTGGTTNNYSIDFGVVPRDLGDLPEVYGTLFPNGASHQNVSGPFIQAADNPNAPRWLGEIVDTEPDGQPGASATGDDLDGGVLVDVNDEDGVSLIGSWSDATLTLTITPNSLYEYDPYQACVVGFIDWNGNGSFADFSDTVVRQLVSADGTAQSFSITNNRNPVTGPSTVYGRFRIFQPFDPIFTSVNASGCPNNIGLGYLALGEAQNGEVEDYAWVVETDSYTDFGDLPDVYGTRSASDGAGHYNYYMLPPDAWTPYLGVFAPDQEMDGIPMWNADGDDLTGVSDDEDGVNISAGYWDEDEIELTIGVGVVGQPPQSGAVACLIGFWDRNTDGDFDDTYPDGGSDILLMDTFTVGSPFVRSYTIPTHYDVSSPDRNQRVFARFRVFLPGLITIPGVPMGADGCPSNSATVAQLSLLAQKSVIGGEVEDYAWGYERIDWGDLPDSYATLSASDGPSHSLYPVIEIWSNEYKLGPMWLGSNVDAEADGQPGAGAIDDDLNGDFGDDEDGVIVTTPGWQTGNVTINVTTTLIGAASRPACLVGWIDWGDDGSFAGDGAINETLFLSPGTEHWSIPVTGSTTANQVYARFRLIDPTVNETIFSRVAVNSYGCPTGTGIPDFVSVDPAINGEVEDYLFPTVLDFGDLPATYQTLSEDNGAAHGLSGFRLGVNIDSEANGQPSPFATGDDVNGTADEDGVSVTGDPTWIGSTTLAVTSSSGTPGETLCLLGWFDWDNDGELTSSFRGIPGGAINRTITAGTPAIINLTTPYDQNDTIWSIPARFRVFRPFDPLLGQVALDGTGCPSGATAPDLLTYGVASFGGEVEDYRFVPLRYDQGDLPDTYQTLISNDGPRHTYPSNTPVFLGSTIDYEPDGIPGSTAEGDDLLYSSDEDGLVLVDDFAQGVATVEITAGGAPGCVVGWFDWNEDGDFLDEINGASELAFAAYQGTGITQYTFATPFPTTQGFTVNARIRIFEPSSGIFTDHGLEIGEDKCPTNSNTIDQFHLLRGGETVNGEVEDYSWDVGPTAVTLSAIRTSSISNPFDWFMLGAVLAAGTIIILVYGKLTGPMKKSVPPSTQAPNS